MGGFAEVRGCTPAQKGAQGCTVHLLSSPFCVAGIHSAAGRTSQCADLPDQRLRQQLADCDCTSVALPAAQSPEHGVAWGGGGVWSSNQRLD